MTKKLEPQDRINRKPISRACAFCHQKHLQCDSGRPCKNCIKRGVQDQCQDVKRKRAKYLSDAPIEPSSISNSTVPKSRTPSLVTEPFPPTTKTTLSTNTPPSRTRISTVDLLNPLNTSSNLFSINSPSRLSSQTPQHLQASISHPHSHSKKSSATGTASESPDVFSSLFANQEYAQLADLLDNNSVNSPSQSSVNNYNEFQTSFQTDNNTRPYISLSDNTTPVGLSTLTNADLSMQATDYTSPLILRHLIKVPEDVYSTALQPYNYPKAYHALLNHLKARFKKDQLIQIAETMAEYRPSFIAATRSLVELDLLFAERSFQRSLLEYESMSSLSSSPTIMWRRTGEIVAVSTEFSSLTSHTKTELLSKRTFIIELMNNNSALDYFKLFSSVAFGDLNGVIITECTLLSPSGEEIRCASTWTVKRDVFDIPMLIVGQFLPILQVR